MVHSVLLMLQVATAPVAFSQTKFIFKIFIYLGFDQLFNFFVY